jgi:hypothetical protein
LNDKLRPHEDQYIRSFGGAPPVNRKRSFSRPLNRRFISKMAAFCGVGPDCSQARLATLKDAAALRKNST